MTTQFKKAVVTLDDVEEKLGDLNKVQDVVERDDAVLALAATLAELQDDIGKMKAKAEESDPDRVTYGKAMAAKVLALANRFAKVTEKVEGVGAGTAAAAKQERAARAQAAADAKRAAEEAAAEKARLEEEAAAEAVKKEAEQRAAAAREKELYEKKKAQAVAKLAARKEAKKKAEAEAKAKAAEEVRLREEGRLREKAELERKRREERAEKEAKLRASLQKRQESTAGAAAASTTAAVQSSAGGAPAATGTSVPLHGGVREGQVLDLEGGRPQLNAVFAAQETTTLFVVQFSTHWCGPCQAMTPIMRDLANDWPEDVVVIHVDAEKPPANVSLASELAITHYPTFVFYRRTLEGTVVVSEQITGAKTYEEMTAKIASFMFTIPEGELQASLTAMKDGLAPEVYNTAVITLVKVVDDLLKNPGDVRYRRVDLNDSALRDNLIGKSEGINCLLHLGFQWHPPSGATLILLYRGRPTVQLAAVRQRMLAPLLPASHQQEAPQPAGASRDGQPAPDGPWGPDNVAWRQGLSQPGGFDLPAFPDHDLEDVEMTEEEAIALAIHMSLQDSVPKPPPDQPEG